MDMHYLSEKEREAKRLEETIIAGQKRLADIRSEIPLMLSGEADIEDITGNSVSTEEDRW